MSTLEHCRNWIIVAGGLFCASLSVAAEAREGTKVWRGEFVYFADSAAFTECASGRRWPVAMEEGYAAVEKAYLGARLQPLAPLLVSLRGRLELRKPMEGQIRDHLVVEELVNAKAGPTCTSPQQNGERR